MSAFLFPPDPGAGQSGFAPTRWTVVLAARGHSEESRQALSALCGAYYAPVVAYLRRDGWRRTEDEARELAHGFFAFLLAGGRMEGADRERGKFRSYLLGALKHWLRDQWRAARAARRGGQAEHVALEAYAESEWEPEAAAAACGPGSGAGISEADLAYDRQWALTVLERALEALGAEFERSGKRAWFETLRPWLSGDPVTESPADPAAVPGMSPGAVKVAVHRLRQRFRARVKSEIAQTLGDGGGDAGEELEYLIRVLG